MNKANYLDKPTYPWASEDFDFIQNNILLLQKLTMLGGPGNYILEGCVKTGTTYSPGIVVMDGEILPFEGGQAVQGNVQGSYLADFVEIVEINEDAQVYDQLYANLRIKRKLVCGGNNIDFGSFGKITSLISLKSLLAILSNSVSSLESSVEGKGEKSILIGSSALKSLGPGATLNFDVDIPDREDALYGVSGSIFTTTPGIVWSVNKQYTKVTFYCTNISSVSIQFRVDYNIYNY